MNEINNSIRLAEIVKEAHKKKLVIFSIFFVAILGSVVLALWLPNKYQTEVVLVPNSAERGQSPGMGALGQLGGLASLAGINLGGGSDKTDYALQVMTSRKFIYQFIQDNNLKVLMFGVKGWDRHTNALIYDEENYLPGSGRWVRDVSYPKQIEPSLLESYVEFVSKHLSVVNDKESGVVRIAITHYSPSVAKELVERIVSAINATIKSEDLENATKSIAFLEQELAATKITGMQSMFYELIEQHTKTIMLTKVAEDYVLKVIDPAVLPEQKHSPKRALIVIVGFILGVLANFLLLVWAALGSRTEKAGV